MNITFMHAGSDYASYCRQTVRESVYGLLVVCEQSDQTAKCGLWKAACLHLKKTDSKKGSQAFFTSDTSPVMLAFL